MDYRVKKTAWGTAIIHRPFGGGKQATLRQTKGVTTYTVFLAPLLLVLALASSAVAQSHITVAKMPTGRACNLESDDAQVVACIGSCLRRNNWGIHAAAPTHSGTYSIWVPDCPHESATVSYPAHEEGPLDPVSHRTEWATNGPR
jgi:hypothetical protein